MITQKPYQTNFQPGYQQFSQKIVILSKNVKITKSNNQINLEKLQHQLELIKQEIQDQGFQYSNSSIFKRYATIQQLTMKKKNVSECCYHCGQQMKKSVQCQLCAQMFCKNCCWRKRVIPLEQHPDFRLSCQQCHQAYIKFFNNQQFYKQKAIYFKAIEELQKKYQKSDAKYKKKQNQVNQYKKQKQSVKIKQAVLKKNLLQQQKKIQQLKQQYAKLMQLKSVKLKQDQQKQKIQDIRLNKEREKIQQEKKSQQQTKQKQNQEQRVRKLSQNRRKIPNEQIQKKQQQIKFQRQKLKKQRKQIEDEKKQIENIRKQKFQKQIDIEQILKQLQIKKQQIKDTQIQQNIQKQQQYQHQFNVLKNKNQQKQTRNIDQTQNDKKQQISITDIISNEENKKQQTLDSAEKVQHKQVIPQRPSITMNQIKSMNINDLLAMKIPMNPGASPSKSTFNKRKDDFMRKSLHLQNSENENSTTTQNGEGLIQSFNEQLLTFNPVIQFNDKKNHQQIEEPPQVKSFVEEQYSETQNRLTKQDILKRSSLISSTNQVNKKTLISQKSIQQNQQDGVVQPQKCACQIM